MKGRVRGEARRRMAVKEAVLEARSLGVPAFEGRGHKGSKGVPRSRASVSMMSVASLKWLHPHGRTQREQVPRGQGRWCPRRRLA